MHLALRIGPCQQLRPRQVVNFLQRFGQRPVIDLPPHLLAAFEAAEKGQVTIKQLAEAAAAQLSNTPTVARNSYIHPAVIDLAGEAPPEIKVGRKTGLFASEARLLTYLEQV